MESDHEGALLLHPLRAHLVQRCVLQENEDSDQVHHQLDGCPYVQLHRQSQYRLHPSQLMRPKLLQLSSHQRTSDQLNIRERYLEVQRVKMRYVLSSCLDHRSELQQRSQHRRSHRVEVVGCAREDHASLAPSDHLHVFRHRAIQLFQMGCELHQREQLRRL